MEIPDTNHVSRYCSAKQIAPSGRVSGAAFKLRPRDEGLLSVNWNEALAQAVTLELQMQELSSIYIGKMTQAVGSNIVVLNVGKTKSYVHGNTVDNRLLEFLHHPATKDHSHSSIKNITLDDEIIPNLIAQTVISKYEIKQQL